MATRFEFTSGVKDELHRRAGGKCSVPRCGKLTSLPTASAAGHINMGVAAHIYSASPGGPRGRGGKDEAFLKSAENGIWCCVEHSTLVDKKKGEDFPAEVIFRWKELAEARVRKQHHDVPSPLGWVHSIVFEEFEGFAEKPAIELSRFTILTGKEGAGKSVLLQAAASVNSSIFEYRFMDDKNAVPRRFVARLDYSTVDNHKQTVKIEFEGGKFLRYENGRRCLLAPGDIQVVALPIDPHRKLPAEDDVDYFSRILGLDRAELFALVEIQTLITMPGRMRLEQGTDYDDDEAAFPRVKEDGKPYIEFKFESADSGHFLSYDSLSGSQQQRVVLGLLIAKAREICKQRLTLLVLDDSTSSLDSNNFRILLELLSKEDFQVIVAVPIRKDRGVDNSDAHKLKLVDAEYLKPWRIAVATARRKNG